MTRVDDSNMAGFSFGTDRCVFCGRPATNRHHVVYRSHGGLGGPTVAVCGMGNASGCHGLLHARVLHLRYDWRTDRWEYLRTEGPVCEGAAQEMDGWRALKRFTRENALTAR